MFCLPFVLGAFYINSREIPKVIPPQIDPLAIYQDGIAVGIIGAEPQLGPGQIALAVTASRELDMTRPFKFRDWTLRCSGSPDGMMSFGVMRQINYPSLICKEERGDSRP